MATRSDEMTAGASSGKSRPESDVKKAVLREEIRSTRDEMSQTVGEIEQKLKPERLKNEALEQLEEAKEKIKSELRQELMQVKDKLRHEYHEAKDAVREATIGRVEHMAHDARNAVSEAGSGVVETIKANPIPAALAGLSLAWLIMNRRTGRRHGQEWQMRGDNGRRFDNNGGNEPGWRRELKHGASAVSDAVHRVEEKAGNIASDVQHQAADWAHDVGDKAGRIVHQAQEEVSHIADMTVREARQVEAYASRMMNENPIAVGAVALALGAAAGLALPRTEFEDELMGETSHQLLEQAGQLAHGVVEKAQEVTKEVTSKLGDAPSHT